MKRDRGVTLLEMLVALAVFGIVATVLFQSFTKTLEARDYAGRRAEIYAGARAVFDWLEVDLKGSLSVKAYPAPPGVELFSSTGHGGADTLFADQPLLDLTVRTSRNTAVLRGEGGEELATNMADQARVRYQVEESDTETGGLALVRYEVRPPLEQAPNAELRTVIAERILSIDFRFETRGAISEQWDQRSGAAAGAGPRLVEIRLSLAGDDGAVAEFVTSVLLPLGGRLG
jgi:prepilin-type N-terminal cleavage/methylation domain-containing protein